MESLNKIKSLLSSGDSLKVKVVRGSFWLYMLEGSSVGLRLIQTVILARLLAPEHFGIIAVFFIFSAGLEGFTQTGFRKALIQQKNVNSDLLDTAWTISIIRGFVLCSLIYIGSAYIVDFFNTPRALPVIRVLGFSILLQGFYNAGTVYFSRDLDFFKQFLWKSSGFSINFLITIPLAFILRNEWALVWGILAGNIVELTISFVLHPYRPQLRINAQAFKKLFSYGKWLLLSSIVFFFAAQGDKMIVTKLLGETLLGIYVIAWRFAKIPELLTNPLPNALFPAYSKFQDDPSVLKEKYIESLRIISLFYIPLVGLMIVLAKPFISIFLGEKWIAAALPMQLLTLGVGISIIVYISQSLFNATGKTSFNFKINCASLLVLSIFMYPLTMQYGVNGAALCYIIVSFARIAVWKKEIGRHIGFRAKDFSCFLFPVINTLFVVLLIMYIGQWFNMNHPAAFFGTIVLSIAVYFSNGLIIEKITGFSIYRDIVSGFTLMKSMSKQEAAR